MHELQAARHCLANIIQGSSSAVVKRIKTKCGIGQTRIDPTDIFIVPSLMTLMPQRFAAETTTTATLQNVNDNHSYSNADNRYTSPTSSGQMERRGFKRTFSEVDNEPSNAFLDQEGNLLPDDEDITCYKCDLCEYFAVSSTSIENHLDQQHHYSASQVIAYKKDGQLQGKTILKPAIIKDENKAFKSLIPVCPVCKTVHKDIFQCSMHHQIEHSKN